VTDKPFVHLHLHSQYSLLDGATKFGPLCDKVKSHGQSAVAVTDHGAMFGAVEFAKIAVAKGVKPIIGCEVYLAPGSRFERGAEAGKNVDYDARYYHLVLLATNHHGYKNLCELVSAGYLEGYYYKPRIDKDLLAAHADGLIALSACLHGEVARNLKFDKYDKAQEAAGFYNEIFPGRFYLEMQDHGIPDQRKVNKLMVKLARDTGLPLVATNDAHYLNREDAVAHDALLCIGSGKSINDENRLRYPGDQFYVKSPEEMWRLFGELPASLTNTADIADQIGFEFEYGKYHLPKYPTVGGKSLEKELEDQAVHGLRLRLIDAEKKGKSVTEEERKAYFARLDMELGVINKMGFPGYFLITADFIAHARNEGIPVGPGRGSAAGSMVAYALKITNLDPIEYDLLFERFLNPDRISMPDIDIDFCMDRRGEVIDYVRKKYEKPEAGATEKQVVQIITFGTMKAKAVVRDVARVMDFPYAEADKIAKLIPNDLKITIATALEQEDRLAKLYKEDERVRELLDVARTLEGTTRHASTHAAGVVISPEPLTNFLPLYKPSGSDDVSTQFPMGDIEGLGLLKMDFLGLRTLTVINNALIQIKENHRVDIDIDAIPLADAKTFDLLAAARTFGVFQLESSGMRDLIRKMKPTDFFDIIALVALFRPGPINSGMADAYVKRKHGHEKVEYDFKELEGVLGETYGVVVYQEQVMKIANVLGGFTLAMADTLRKAMGKKKAEIMNDLREKFVEGAVARDHDRAKAEELWGNIEKFGEYGFNKSHSACYALVAYQTAYLKAHYPAEYMASLITSEMDNSDKVLRYIQECRDLGMPVIPPDVNESMSPFAVVDGRIRFGMAAVKGVGGASVEAIIAARNADGPFASMVDFAERVEPGAVNRRVLEALVKCGAFDSMKEPRQKLFMNVEKVLAAAQKTRRDKDMGQADIFSLMGGGEGADAGAVALDDFPEWEEKVRLANEKEALGFYLTGHPLSEHVRDLKLFATYSSATVDSAPQKGEVRIGGVITAKRAQPTRKGDLMARITLEDMQGSVEVLVMPKTYAECVDLLDAEEPIFVRGFADVDDEQGSVKVIANELLTFSQARAKFTNSVHVQMSTVGMERETLEELKKIFEARRGKSPVTLHMKTPRGVVTMRTDGCAVSATEELIADVEALIGEESVTLE
jgi:DNA polymerase-3 subunit alpha